MSSHQLFSLSTELVEFKIEEFLILFGEKLNSLTEEAFNTQVCVCVFPLIFFIIREKTDFSFCSFTFKFTHPKRPKNKP